MKIKIIFITLLLLTAIASQNAYSQVGVNCFVNPGVAQITYEASNPQVFSGQNLYPSQRILSIHLHLVANSLNNYYPDSAGVQQALDNLNQAFERSGISFRYCEIDSVENYKYNGFSIDAEIEEVKTLFYKAGVINIFVVEGILINGITTFIEGHTFFPGGDDIIIITRQEFLLNGLPHQMGHFFGLYHTFEDGFGSEYVDGSNCATSGDLICDTPADITVAIFDCIPNNTMTDANGDKYHHPFDNMMSAARSCRCTFSIAQLNKMVYNLHNNRSYLK